ncbi:hypothetical protein GJAV_G00217150 [Gymnothorax javanicus]|nr:hypothetical protein GJAV_G00217150 [Gymnothorax javanicus]
MSRCGCTVVLLWSCDCAPLPPQFVRLSCDTPPEIVYDLLTKHWKVPAPNLVVSVVGGEGKEKVKPWVREVLRQGLVKAAQSTGAWILAGGLQEGVGRCIGEAVRDHSTAASSVSNNKVVALGVAPWGLVHNRHQLVNPEGSFPARYSLQNTSRESFCLDNNYQAFFLVDDGSVGRKGGETGFTARLEEYISYQKTSIRGSGSIEIPVLCMLVAGTKHMLKRVDLSLQKATPWMVLAGSGGAADLICEILGDLASLMLSSSTSEAEGEDGELNERVREHVKKFLPSVEEKDLEKMTDRALSIYQNRDLITVFHGEQDGPDNFDNMLLKALVRASKRVSTSASEYTEELKLAVAWNRVDIAKSELFNGDIQWRHKDLEDLMTDALVNDKPQFVRLFTENGLDILDYLTNQRLEELYRTVSDSTLAYSLLQRRLSERRSIFDAFPAPTQLNTTFSFKDPESALLGAGSFKDLSLYEVSRLLWDIMGDVCQPFYYGPLGLDHSISTKKALKMVNKLMVGECHYRNQPCSHPWAALFIWAILQNRSEMAMYFWEKEGDPVLSALSGCKMLRELSKLELETETALSMKELALKFENLAHDVFGECYQSSESRSFTLLIRKSPVWGGATCLQMAMAANARLFFSHDGVQSLLSQIWWGDMERNTEVWKFLLCFFCPPLIYTQLLSFRKDEDEGESNDIPLAKEPDSQDGDTVLSFPDIVQTEEEAEECKALRSQKKPEGSSPSNSKRTFILNRWRRFWFSPVTSFVGNVLMYFLFLILFAYVLLVDFKPAPPLGPAPTELVLYFWVFTLVCEEIRQSFIVGTTRVYQRMRQYFQDIWNKCDFVAISLFIFGLCCRMFPWSCWFGRCVLCIDFMVFTLRLIHIFAVHKELGPKIIMVGKMMKDTFFFMFFLGVWLLAYGVANQALQYAYDSRPRWVLWRVFYLPYLVIFGYLPPEDLDLEKAEEDQKCTNDITLIDNGAEPCVDDSTHSLVVILLVIYLLVTNILLLNLLIAIFSYTFSQIQDHSDTHWKYQRYNLIVEYHSRPCLPPPFIILFHIHLLIKRFIRKVPSEKIRHFVLELKGRKASRLMTWESIQKENHLSAQNKIQRESDSARLKCTSVKVDSVLSGTVKQMAEFRDHDRRLRMVEAELEYCSSALSWMVEALTQSNLIKPSTPPPTRREPSLSSP